MYFSKLKSPEHAIFIVVMAFLLSISTVMAYAQDVPQTAEQNVLAAPLTPTLPALPELNCDDLAAASESIAELATQNLLPEQIYRVVTPEQADTRTRILHLFIIPPITDTVINNNFADRPNMREHCRHNRKGYIDNINTVCEMFVPLIEQAVQARDTSSTSREQSSQTTIQTFEAAVPRGQDHNLDLANTVMTDIGIALIDHIYDHPEKNAMQLTMEFNTSCLYRSN